MKGRSGGACGAWQGGAREIGKKKGCFTLNTSHVSTFTCAPKIAGRVVRLARLEQANDNSRIRLGGGN